MILEQNIWICRYCGGEQLRKNGRTDCGAHRVQYRSYGKTLVLDLAPPAYTQQERERILSAHVRKRLSTRGTTRLFGVAYNTLSGWLGEKPDEAPALEDTLLPGEAGDVLELDKN